MDIIVNPISGGGASKKALAQISNYLQNVGVSFQVHETKMKKDATSIAQKLCAAGTTKIAVIGGDGTFHEVLNGMDFSRARIGFIPAGSGNDYMKSVLLPRSPVAAINAIVKGEPMDIDYMQAGSHRCLNVGGTGIDVEVLRLAEKSRNALSYVASLFACLLHYKPYQVRIEILDDGIAANKSDARSADKADEQPSPLAANKLDKPDVQPAHIDKIYSCLLVAFCKGQYFGGGIQVCPTAKIDDGFLHLVIAEKPGNKPAVFAMPEFINGKHLKKDWVTYAKCSRIKISTPQPIELDGEIYDEHEMEVSVVRGGLKTFRMI